MEIYLKCGNGLHDDIYLPDGKAIVIGRSQDTKITDTRCSRKQVELTADYAKKLVNVKQLGANSSFVNGREVKKDESTSFKENETLYIVQKDFPHELLFVPDKDNINNNESKKRTLSDFFAPAKPSKKMKMSKQEDSSDEEAVSKKLKLLQKQDLKSESNSSKITSKSQSKTINSSETSESCPSTRGSGWYQPHKNLLVFESDGLLHSSKIVAFDMDGTLITTKSGKTFATDSKDWRILYNDIPNKLKKLREEGLCKATSKFVLNFVLDPGHKLVIITNQLGIGKGKVKEKDFKEKVENVVKALGVPFQVLAVTDRGIYRKPNIGSWNWLRDFGNGGILIREEGFVYVGDAAGRPKNWAPGKKKDFSCSDRLFSMNLNASFFTPEEYFLSHKTAKFDLPPFNPKSVVDQPLTDGAEIVSKNQEVVILVGYPASGKSTFTKNHLEANGYKVINRDKLKTWQKCVSACDAALAAGKSVAIDNTNPDAESRLRFRELSGSEHDVVPKMIIYSYRKKFVEPKLSEGFSEIVRVNFVPNFENQTMKTMYSMYTD